MKRPRGVYGASPRKDASFGNPALEQVRQNGVDVIEAVDAPLPGLEEIIDKSHSAIMRPTGGVFKFATAVGEAADRTAAPAGSAFPSSTTPAQ